MTGQSDRLNALLASHVDPPTLSRLQGASMRLLGTLEVDERLLRVADATHFTQIGLLAVTTRGVRFVSESPSTPLFVSGDAISEVRPAVPDVVSFSDSAGGEYVFDDLGGTAWPREITALIRTLVDTGPGAAAALADRYEEGRAAPAAAVADVPSAPVGPPSSSSEPGFFTGAFVAAVVVLSAVSLGWLFGFSSVTIGPDRQATEDCSYGEVGFDCVEPLFGAEDGYDCGTVGGALWRSTSNESGLVLEAEVDKQCQRAAFGNGWPLAGSVAMLGIAFLFLRR